MKIKSGRKVRYAVVGLGYISQVALLPSFKNARSNSELVALVSSDEKKLRVISRKYKVKQTYSYEQYDECLNSGKIDAVYIGLPNSMHREYTERAARAGIHVLCEKPMAVTRDECQSMIDVCDENNVKLMIAYRLHLDKANLQASQIANSGKLGKIRIYQSLFTQNVEDKQNIRLQSAKGGGTFYDIGIYCLNAARYIFKAEPLEVTAFTASRSDSRFAEVEEMGSVVMRFPDDRLAVFTNSFGAEGHNSYTVVGTQGKIEMQPAFDYAEGLKMKVTIKGKTKTLSFKKTDQFGAELSYFSDCVLKGHRPEPSGIEGLEDVNIIEAMYKSARSGKTVKISATEPTRRPSLKNKIIKPGIREPEVIDANSPSSDT